MHESTASRSDGLRVLRALAAGSKASTAEAEQELLQLWSGVEKERAAQQERAARHRRRSSEAAPAASRPVRPDRLRPDRLGRCLLCDSHLPRRICMSLRGCRDGGHDAWAISVLRKGRSGPLRRLVLICATERLQADPGTVCVFSRAERPVDSSAQAGMAEPQRHRAGGAAGGDGPPPAACPAPHARTYS